MNVKDGKCCNTVEEKSEKKRHRPRRAMKEIDSECETWFCLVRDSCKPLESYSIPLNRTHRGLVSKSVLPFVCITHLLLKLNPLTF